MRRKHFRIYQSRRHLASTILVILIPFGALLLFSARVNGASGRLVLDVLSSGWRMTVAYGIAAVLGWISAVFFYRGKWSKIAIPMFDVLQSFPNFAALPIAVKLFGGSDALVVFFLIFTIIWPIFFTIISSLKLIRSDWEEAAAMARLSAWEYFRYFLWPVSQTGLITGSIIGIGEAWEALVATEIIIGTKTGVGDFLQTYSQNPVVTAFGMLGFLLVIFLINKLIWLPMLEWSHAHMEE